MAQPALAEQAGETLEHQQGAVVVKTEGLGAQRVDAFACDRREMCQQRVGVDGIRIFLVAGEQEQALAVQTGREVLPAQLDRKSTRLNSSHVSESRMPSSA